MARFSLLPREDQYFSFFSQMTSYIFDASRLLVEMLGEGGQHKYDEYAQRIKSIEHACDELTHTVSTQLNKSFITPFDREDIYMLSSALDDIVDLMDDASRAMVMFDVRESSPHARRFADVIHRMAVQLHEVVSALAKPVGLTPRLIEIHRLENEGDDIYHAAIGELFRRGNHPLPLRHWEQDFETIH